MSSCRLPEGAVFIAMMMATLSGFIIAAAIATIILILAGLYASVSLIKKSPCPRKRLLTSA